MKESSFIISRTDSVGDVVLTLPVAGLLKKHFPGCSITFLGREYTKPVIEACSHIDRFASWDEIRKLSLAERKKIFRSFGDCIIHVFPDYEIASLAAAAGIPVRIGSSRRIWNWWTCNKRVWVKRKNSPLHETQLNVKLLQPLVRGISLAREEVPSYYGLPAAAGAGSGKFRLAVHPLTRGSAREWGISRFASLINALDPAKFDIFITGTKEEKERALGLPFHLPHVHDTMGRMSLAELMKFLGTVDGMVACSTGPLHLAAAMGKLAAGIYAPLGPVHPRRWAPLGRKVKVFFTDKKCSSCRGGGRCVCMEEVLPAAVADFLNREAEGRGLQNS